ncbi:MAG TPA: M15 family metallopeptidase [Xanthobacteraceae bacterium]|jgi:D-alanyl-D-alanine dipeptidase|nr:M15 family metallopeptidase [Xanthobacteraceae bacterium]
MLKSGFFARSVAVVAVLSNQALGGSAAIAQQAASPDIVQTRPAAFVDAATIVPGLIPEMRYATAHNFTARPIDGYEARRCLLTREAAEALAAVARDLAPRSLVIKAFDCYRPTRAVENFVRWARDINDQAARAEFYPNVDKRTLFRDGYIASHSGHSRGSTIDMTLAHADGTELDMGTHFDFFSPRSWTADPSVTPEQHANRMLLVAAMRRHGFRNYEKEWWHYTLTPEPFPDTYFNFPVR